MNIGKISLAFLGLLNFTLTNIGYCGNEVWPNIWPRSSSEVLMAELSLNKVLASKLFWSTESISASAQVEVIVVSDKQAIVRITDENTIETTCHFVWGPKGKRSENKARPQAKCDGIVDIPLDNRLADPIFYPMKSKISKTYWEVYQAAISLASAGLGGGGGSAGDGLFQFGGPYRGAKVKLYEEGTYQALVLTERLEGNYWCYFEQDSLYGVLGHCADKDIWWQFPQVPMYPPIW